jgi:hypothetical protein
MTNKKNSASRFRFSFSFCSSMVPAILTPYRRPSNAVIPSSRSQSNRKPVLYLNSPHITGPVYDWYFERKGVSIKVLEHRKEYDTFQHEYILVELVDGSMFRIDRRPDPDVPIDTIMRTGCDAFDTIEMVSSKGDLPPSNIVASFETSINPTALDCLFILRICYAVKQGRTTWRYTLQNFNCYFLSWTIFMICTRKAAPPVFCPYDLFRAKLKGCMEQVRPVEVPALLLEYRWSLWSRAMDLALNAGAEECETQFRSTLWTHQIDCQRMSLKFWTSVLERQLNGMFGGLPPFTHTKIKQCSWDWLSGAILALASPVARLCESTPSWFAESLDAAPGFPEEINCYIVVSATWVFLTFSLTSVSLICTKSDDGSRLRVTSLRKLEEYMIRKIENHASRVGRYRLGVKSHVSLDMIREMERIWQEATAFYPD